MTHLLPGKGGALCFRTSRKPSLRRILISFICLIWLLAFPYFRVDAGSPATRNQLVRPGFTVAAFAGYGFTTSNLRTSGSSDVVHGATLSIRLGYQLSEKFSLEAGPAFWLQGNQLFRSNAAEKETPVNKRTLVSLSVIYKISDRFPLALRLGGGAGNLVYTPPAHTISADFSKYRKTEIMSGPGAIAGFSYPLKIAAKTDLTAGSNVWCLWLNDPSIAYHSEINTHKVNFTSEFYLQLRYKF